MRVWGATDKYINVHYKWERRKQEATVLTGKCHGDCSEISILDFSMKWERISAGGKGPYNSTDDAEPQEDPFCQLSPQALEARGNLGEC